MFEIERAAGSDSRREAEEHKNRDDELIGWVGGQGCGDIRREIQTLLPLLLLLLQLLLMLLMLLMLMLKLKLLHADADADADADAVCCGKIQLLKAAHAHNPKST